MTSRMTSVGRLHLARRIGVPKKHYFAFGGIQHEVIVGKPRSEFGDAFRNLSETGLRIEIRGNKSRKRAAYFNNLFTFGEIGMKPG